MADITLIKQEKIDEIIEAIKTVAQAIMDLFKKIVASFKELFNNFWKSLKEFLKQENPKIYFLAYQHPKQRTRKKNQKRLWKTLIKKIE